jgi:RNA polymerase sigma-70 factor (ECF subfamily)
VTREKGPDELESLVHHDARGMGDLPRVRRAMHELTEAHRRVVELAYFDGQTCAEIAKSVGIPIGTVKSRLANALQVLRRAIACPKEIALRSA